MSRLLPALVLAAAVLASAPAAPARAPTAAEQSSMDALLRRLRKEREEDQKLPVAQDPFALYEAGGVALEDFKAVRDAIRDKRTRPVDRERATSAILKRFQMEDQRGAMDVRKITEARKALLNDLLPLMVEGDDPGGRACIHRLTQPQPSGLLKEGNVAWNPGDTPKRRQEAFLAIRKLLK